MPQIREKDFLRKASTFPIFTPKLPPLEMWGQFLVSLPYKCFIPNLIKIGLVVLEKVLTQDGRWMTYDDGRQPIAIG